MVINHKCTKAQVQTSVCSKDSVETNGRTGGWMLLIALNTRYPTTPHWCRSDVVADEQTNTLIGRDWSRSNFAETFVIQKLESLGYHVAFVWFCVWPFWYNTGVWRTDRRTEGHMTTANTALAWSHAVMNYFERDNTDDVIIRSPSRSTGWAKKVSHYTLVHIFAKYWLIFIILSPTHSVGNLQ